MPKGHRYSSKAKYVHHRQKNPNLFKKNSFRNVKLSHTKYHGKTYSRRKNSKNRAIVGKEKKSGKWKIQSILTPKKK